MRLTFCVACGAIEDLRHHHLVTRAEGGSDDERNLITLCCGCHLKLHERQRRNERSLRELLLDWRGL
jgi:5-methylcytosine-specific restriction endonuclease McrA